MYYGFLPQDKEAHLISIMSENVNMEIIDDVLVFTMDNGEKPIVKITSMPKPLLLGNYEDKNLSTIMKKCVVVEAYGEILPIFKNGDIFVFSVPDGCDVPQKTHIKSAVAATFFNYALTVYGRLVGE